VNVVKLRIIVNTIADYILIRMILRTYTAFISTTTVLEES